MQADRSHGSRRHFGGYLAIVALSLVGYLATCRPYWLWLDRSHPRVQNRWKRMFLIYAAPYRFLVDHSPSWIVDVEKRYGDAFRPRYQDAVDER